MASLTRLLGVFVCCVVPITLGCGHGDTNPKPKPSLAGEWSRDGDSSVWVFHVDGRLTVDLEHGLTFEGLYTVIIENKEIRVVFRNPLDQFDNSGSTTANDLIIDEILEIEVGWSTLATKRKSDGAKKTYTRQRKGQKQPAIVKAPQSPSKKKATASRPNIATPGFNGKDLTGDALQKLPAQERPKAPTAPKTPVQIEIVAALGSAMLTEEFTIAVQSDQGAVTQRTLRLSRYQQERSVVLTLPKAGTYVCVLTGFADVKVPGRVTTRRHILKAQGPLTITSDTTFLYVRQADPRLAVYTAQLVKK